MVRMTPRRIIGVGIAVTGFVSMVLYALVPKNEPEDAAFQLKWIPHQVTYISNGTLHKGHAGNFITVPEKMLDKRISQYTEMDIMQIYNTLKILSKTLKKRYNSLRLFPRIVTDPELNKAWSVKTMELIQYIIDIRNGSENTLPGIETTEDMLREVKILRTRVFPREPRADLCKGCFHRRFTPLIHAWTACESPGSIQLVILVTSFVKDYAARMAIRSTWGSVTKKNTADVRIVFIVGQTGKNSSELILESNRYRDIVQGKFIEGYYNSTYNIIGGFKWMHHSCPGARFVMVTHSDVFVNVLAIKKLLWKYGHGEVFQNYQVGKCYASVMPYRIPDSKDYVSTFEYDRDMFPPYADGSLMLFSSSLVKKILKLSPDIPFICRGELYMGLVLETLGRGCHDVQGLLLEFNNKIPALPYFALRPFAPVQMITNYRNLIYTSNRALSNVFNSKDIF